MNEAHIHLMVNHLPVIGLLISIGVLTFAVFRRQPEFIRLGLWLVFLTALSTIPAYYSGEGAEEVVEHLPGISESLIEEHEELAEIGFLISQLTGLLALAGIMVSRRSDRYLRPLSILTIAAASGTLGFLGMVANSGGKINHPELRDVSTQGLMQNGEQSGEHDEHDEHDKHDEHDRH